MSDHDWRQTPTLDEFNAMYDEDDNIWWRIACGHHQNLYEAAVERYQTAEAAIQRVRELCEQTTVSVSIGCRCYTDECSGTCGAGRPLSWHLNPAAVLAALDGDSDE